VDRGRGERRDHHGRDQDRDTDPGEHRPVGGPADLDDQDEQLEERAHGNDQQVFGQLTGVGAEDRVDRAVNDFRGEPICDWSGWGWSSPGRVGSRWSGMPIPGTGPTSPNFRP
jgi:hypothetical protein